VDGGMPTAKTPRRKRRFRLMDFIAKAKRRAERRAQVPGDNCISPILIIPDFQAAQHAADNPQSEEQSEGGEREPSSPPRKRRNRVFARSVKENIAYRLDECSEAEVELAAEMANAHSFIVGTSDQYKTNVGEKGSQMSGESPFPDNDLSP
jgi:hypothetical protein